MAAAGELTGGHTPADVRTYFASAAAARGLPAWLRLVGGVDELDPGHYGSWTGTLAAGSYVLTSFTPDQQGRPDAVDGFLAPFTARGGPSTPAADTRAGATVTLGAGGTLSMTGLPAGTSTIALVNRDSVPRTVNVTAIKSGKTFDDVMAEARRGAGVPPSLTRLGGTLVPPHGSVVIGIEPAVHGRSYVVFDIDHVSQGAIVDKTCV